ncbi:MAG: tetratricopeptide repeat protein [Candidatus Omnitrophota bacterium]
MRIRGINLLIITLGVMIIAGKAPVGAQDYSIDSRKQKLEKAKDYFSLGQLFVKNGDYTAANAEFVKAELMMQEASMIQLAEETGGKLKEGSRDKQEEMFYYLEEIKKKTSDPDYYFNLGLDFLNKGQFIQAEESFKSAVKLDPWDKDSCYNLGVLYENYLGNSEKAREFYLQYLDIAPDAPDAKQVKSWISELK